MIWWYDVLLCDALPCDVLLCDVLSCDVLLCDVLWYDVLLCDVLPCDVLSCDVLWYDVLLCDVLPCDALLCDVLSWDVLLWCIMMWCTALWCIVTALHFIGNSEEDCFATYFGNAHFNEIIAGYLSDSWICPIAIIGYTNRYHMFWIYTCWYLIITEDNPNM